MGDLHSLLLLGPAKILPPNGPGSYLDLALRWVHLASGISWIGLLYFFNLVSAPGLARLDGPTRSKLIPLLLPRAFWWFRWSAVTTVLAGFAYWVLLFHREIIRHDGRADFFLLGISLFDWFIVATVAWIATFFLLRVPFLARNGYLFALVLAPLLLWVGREVALNSMPQLGHRIVSIAIGGAYGYYMLLNVWGIVWPAQKQLIAWTVANPEVPPPPELAARLRQAALVSRASFWLSFPMLFFMAAASHFPFFAAR